MKIKKFKARRVWNSRREPTIEVSVNKWKASTPSGASTGGNEVRSFPEQGVDYVVKLLNDTYRDKIIGMEINEFKDLNKIESLLKIPEIGGNSVLAVEYATLRALSVGKVYSLFPGKKMPMPLGNCVGGGKHFKGKGIDIQEILLMPKAKNFKDMAFANAYIHKTLGKRLRTKKISDEGAWAPDMGNLEALDIVRSVVDELSKKFGYKIDIGIDMAANSLFDGTKYKYREGSKSRNAQIKFVLELIDKYHLKYVEDPLEEKDMEGFAKINKKSKGCLICGDDLLCTNPNLVRKAIEAKAVSAAIVKPNQIGSLISAYEVVKILKDNKITPVISHRSGETYDSSIADLAVGWGIPILKCGIKGKERQAKLNRVMRIEKEIS